MAKLPVNKCNLFFFDSETSGLDPNKNELIEVAAIITDPNAEKILWEYTARTFPTHDVDPRAAAINGYTKEAWEGTAIPLDEAMNELVLHSRDAVFIAHNVAFDWGFMQVAMAKRMQRWAGDYHKIDTVALAWPLLSKGLVPNVKLTTLSDYFKIPHENAHTAMADARACMEVYKKLMKMIAIPEAATAEL